MEKLESSFIKEMFRLLEGRQKQIACFDESIATFEDDKGAYNQKDAEGFIKLNALRMRIAARKRWSLVDFSWLNN